MLLHTLVEGYDVSMLAVRVFVRPTVVETIVRPSVNTRFSFEHLNIYLRLSFRFCICICTKNVSLGIVTRKVR